MRQLLEQFSATTVVVVFTTYGHVHVGTVNDIDQDLVVLRGTDRRTLIHVNLKDISGVREHSLEEEVAP